jgi:CHAT domain-containing protein
MHRDVVVSLNNLALLYRAQGAFGKAEPLLARAAEIREGQLRVQLARLSEPRKRAMMMRLQRETDNLVSLHADAAPSSRQALELALTTILRRKGRILDSLVDNETTLRARLTPSLRDQLDQLTQARSELVARLYAPTGPRSATDRMAITAARARIDELESALSAASAEFRVQSEAITVAKIQTALPSDAALVEFVRYRRFDAQQVQHHWQEDRYVAYLMTSHGPPQWVTLGAAAPIDSEVDAMLSAMHSKVPMATTRAALRRLDVLVFAPIRERLPNVSHVILAPDSKLNVVPFGALVDPQGRYVMEEHLVSYVTTGRDLLRLVAPQSPRSPAVIVAGPDYGPLPSSAVPGTRSFAPLAGALAEATDLQKYFPTTPVTGEKATKRALAALTGPAILHIATHGFYARDPGPSPTPPESTMSPMRAVPRPEGSARFAQTDSLRGIFVDGGDASPLTPLRSEDPADGLDRAGLAMAGANQGAGGIVTAREIAGFDWWGTQLVVLSACETGVGAVPSGDGVYGLRRALMLAGVASQVVSLWSVNDSSTRALMRGYYDELARGTGRAEALRRAQLRLARQSRYTHPYYWAAFIPAGDWRPLSKPR